MDDTGVPTTPQLSQWGPDDELGAGNLLTSEVVRHATGLVDKGEVFSLAISIDANTPTPGRASPQHFMTLDGGDFAAGFRLGSGRHQAADDFIAMHVQTGSHIDGLAHVWYDGHLYNGHPAESVRSYGATRCGIENLQHMVTRGVLIDVAGYVGNGSLPDGFEIDVEVLVAVLGDRILRSGDVALLHTGWLEDRLDSEQPVWDVAPGLTLDGARFLADAGVSAVGADNPAVERVSGLHRYGDGTDTPEVHCFLLCDRGIYLLEMLALGALARVDASTFLFVVAPLPIRGGTGSPVNPLAIL